MNHDVYTAPNTVRPIGIRFPHIFLLEAPRILISVEAHFGQTPVVFNGNLLEQSRR